MPYDHKIIQLLLVCQRIPFSIYLTLKNIVTLKLKFIG